ncbi:hypothetical protein AB0D99_33795 [Streptomyces sp. NPDC047971]|uniref:hypothetical protein n=1 Tax=Streptomyces sp. NPDC047971 TaxID=3154499 RepID=UPI0033F16636
MSCGASCRVLLTLDHPIIRTVGGAYVPGGRRTRRMGGEIAVPCRHGERTPAVLDLATAGTSIEMTSRILEPDLLALAVLAIRGRIQR